MQHSGGPQTGTLTGTKKKETKKETKKEERGSLRSPSAREQWPDRYFDDHFWPAYPHKVGKADAKKALSVIRNANKVTFKIIMVGLERYIRDKPTDRQWLNPGTFIRQGRWDDEPAPPINGTGKKGWGETAKEMMQDDEERNAGESELPDVGPTLPSPRWP